MIDEPRVGEVWRWWWRIPGSDEPNGKYTTVKITNILKKESVCTITEALVIDSTYNIYPVSSDIVVWHFGPTYKYWEYVSRKVSRNIYDELEELLQQI
jgi:hypothetical protein